MKTLRFLAVEGDHSFSPARARVGQMQPIGKTREEDGSFSLNEAPSEVTVGGPEEHEDIGFLRGEVKDGRLVIADKGTGETLGMPFDAVKAFHIPLPEAPAPPPFESTLHVDTLSPPSLDEPFDDHPKSAPLKRKDS